MKIIVFEKEDKGVGYLIPTQEVLTKYTISQVALKDVREGLPFWIVDDTELPSDRTFRDAWEIPGGWGDPDGYGSVFYTFEGVEDVEH
jgi:hypothetical protein